VDLAGAANGQSNYTWSLERSSASYNQVTLQPGGTAHRRLGPYADAGRQWH